jgi:hypothetical protein
MSPNELVDLWRAIASGPPAGSGLDRRLLDLDAPVSLYACAFWPSGRFGLLIEGESAQRLTDGRIPKCRGVKLVHNIVSSSPPRTVLQIILEDVRLTEIFAVLCTDLVQVARHESSAAVALRQCIDRLAMWQGLFERIPPEGLSEEEQRGLFGELVVLEDVLLNSLDRLGAVTAWTGPEPKNQDFIHGGLALEVKTSLAKRHSRLTINNEKQLDERPHERLFLTHVRLDESVSQGMTLPGMVDRCRAQLESDPVAARLFDDRLMAGGYLDIHAALYAGNSWKPSSVRLFVVDGDFPRLTEANLPPGVGDIRYSIIADDLGSYEVGIDEVILALKGE